MLSGVTWNSSAGTSPLEQHMVLVKPEPEHSTCFWILENNTQQKLPTVQGLFHPACHCGMATRYINMWVLPTFPLAHIWSPTLNEDLVSCVVETGGLGRERWRGRGEEREVLQGQRGEDLDRKSWKVTGMWERIESMEGVGEDRDWGLVGAHVPEWHLWRGTQDGDFEECCQCLQIRASPMFSQSCKLRLEFLLNYYGSCNALLNVNSFREWVHGTPAYV